MLEKNCGSKEVAPWGRWAHRLASRLGAQASERTGHTGHQKKNAQHSRQTNVKLGHVDGQGNLFDAWEPLASLGLPVTGLEH
ncbi:Uncharacterized protein TCM_013100 [Theobroma cacao]|uniref:Uncharacterized protein n=1 Tax=Theobroma cacao TaxID=3641 RepID=A0A061G380_THECC|nr:Uncharacterized protein TCM_013100 [Theobroma cacao]